MMDYPLRSFRRNNNHERVKMLYDPSHFILQQLDYLNHDIYHEFIKMFHVKMLSLIPQQEFMVDMLIG